MGWPGGSALTRPALARPVEWLGKNSVRYAQIGLIALGSSELPPSDWVASKRPAWPRADLTRWVSADPVHRSLTRPPVHVHGVYPARAIPLGNAVVLPSSGEKKW